MFICQFCTNQFTTQILLKRHQGNTKYCLKIQKQYDDTINIENSKFECEFCNKCFSSKQKLNNHIEKNCNKKIIKIENNFLEKYSYFENNILLLEENLQEKDNKNLKLQVENDLLRKQMDTLMSKNTEKECLFELQDKLKEIAMVAIEQKNETISMMVKKYVKKQPRVKYDEQNVFYILTTKLLKTDNRYIFGKAKNLTSRLSTYNKSDEHEVVFYQSCGSEEQMGNVENVVFQKLSEYREQANRERFILPLGKSVDYFVKEVINIIEFLK